MALNATQLLDGINAAEFTAEEWANAMLYLKLTVELGLVRAQMANASHGNDVQQAEYRAVVVALQAQETELTEQINALAPSA